MRRSSAAAACPAGPAPPASDVVSRRKQSRAAAAGQLRFPHNHRKHGPENRIFPARPGAPPDHPFRCDEAAFLMPSKRPAPAKTSIAALLLLGPLLAVPPAGAQPLSPALRQPSPLQPTPLQPVQAQPMPAQAAQGQNIVPPAGGQPMQIPPNLLAVVPPVQQVTLEAGTGRLLMLPRPAAVVLAAEPRIARVQPASPTSVFVMGAEPGRTTVIATTEDGQPVAQYDITVNRSVATPSNIVVMPDGTVQRTVRPASVVQAAIRGVLRGAGDVQVALANESYILSGTVPTAADAWRAEAVARAFLNEQGSVVNNLQVLSSIQVNLRVRVAEMSREITRELGINWQALANTGDFLFGLRSGSALSLERAILGGVTGANLAPSRLAGAIRSSRFDINGVIDALAADRLISILAEPNLTALSGETASFLAGGEFPIPVGTSNLGQITIEFKQYGVSLAFVPTVLGPDRLNLRVRPEVSELSENGAVEMPVLTGTVRIPALTVRRAETTIELGSGQSFAIAGLLQRGVRQLENGIAGLGEVPVLGPLFRSDSFRRNETELVIIVTPYIVRPAPSPAELRAPTDMFRPATDLERVLERRQIGRVAPAWRPASPVDAGFIVD
jgi:pilus assembly protein CpaC